MNFYKCAILVTGIRAVEINRRNLFKNKRDVHSSIPVDHKKIYEEPNEVDIFGNPVDHKKIYEEPNEVDIFGNPVNHKNCQQELNEANIFGNPIDHKVGQQESHEEDIFGNPVNYKIGQHDFKEAELIETPPSYNKNENVDLNIIKDESYDIVDCLLLQEYELKYTKQSFEEKLISCILARKIDERGFLSLVYKGISPLHFNRLIKIICLCKNGEFILIDNFFLNGSPALNQYNRQYNLKDKQSLQNYISNIGEFKTFNKRLKIKEPLDYDVTTDNTKTLPQNLSNFLTREVSATYDHFLYRHFSEITEDKEESLKSETSLVHYISDSKDTNLESENTNLDSENTNLDLESTNLGSEEKNDDIHISEESEIIDKPSKYEIAEHQENLIFIGSVVLAVILITYLIYTDRLDKNIK